MFASLQYWIQDLFKEVKGIKLTVFFFSLNNLKYYEKQKSILRSKKNPELNKPTILAWGILESFISGDDKTDPPKERCPIRSM